MNNNKSKKKNSNNKTLESSKTSIHKNGGFPPIKYCGESDVEGQKVSKERSFTTIPKKNINIRQLLTTKNKKPIVVISEEDEQIEEIDKI